MGGRRQINGKDFLCDLRSGMVHSELQVKYKLSAKSLHTVIKKLVECNAITHSELHELSCFYRERVDSINRRAYARAYLVVYLPVYHIGSGAIGALRDISETGLRVAGIASSVGEATKFQIPIDLFMQADPVIINAECKWAEIRGRHRRYPVAGFKIIDLSERDSQILRDFTKFLLLGESGEWHTIG